MHQVHSLLAQPASPGRTPALPRAAPALPHAAPLCPAKPYAQMVVAHFSVCPIFFFRIFSSLFFFISSSHWKIQKLYTYFFFHFPEYSNKFIKIYFIHFYSVLLLVKPQKIFSSYLNQINLLKFSSFSFLFPVLLTVKL